MSRTQQLNIKKSKYVKVRRIFTGVWSSNLVKPAKKKIQIQIQKTTI